MRRKQSPGRSPGSGRKPKGVLRHQTLFKTSAEVTLEDPGPLHLPHPQACQCKLHTSPHTERPSVSVQVGSQVCTCV